jgi:hypothetical protein
MAWSASFYQLDAAAVPDGQAQDDVRELRRAGSTARGLSPKLPAMLSHASSNAWKIVFNRLVRRTRR